MPKLSDNQNPSYRLHKSSVQAIVTLNGRDILLGKHGTTASRAEYDRRIAEWISAGRRSVDPASDLTVTELIARYRVHVEAYYRRADGTPTGEADNIAAALKPLRKLYGAAAAAEFSPFRPGLPWLN
jgi:hypothetical protein